MYQINMKEGLTSDISSRSSLPLLIHSYSPLVKRAQIVAVFMDQEGLFATVSGQETGSRFPVYTDYPHLGKRKLSDLKRFFAQSYALIKKRDGVLDRIHIALALPGGGIGDDMLPGHAGYSIGDVIEKKYLPLPKWKEQRAEIEGQLKFKAKELLREKMQSSELYEKQQKINECIADINRLKVEHLQVSKKIQEISKEPTYLEKSLPIDPKRSQTRLNHNSFYLEKMDHFSLKGENGVNDEEISTSLDELMARVFPGDGAFTYLPPGTVDKVAQGVKNILSSKSEVFVVGSFITLARSKVMDPVVLRENAGIDQDLVGEEEEDGTYVSDKYVVLTEAVLGGLFIGYGKAISMSGAQNLIIDENEKNSFSSSQTVAISFISQGAIPKIGTEPDLTNLWGAYTSWKDTLRNDPHSGYPVGYKYTNLTDILRENNRSLKDGRRNPL